MNAFSVPVLLLLPLLHNPFAAARAQLGSTGSVPLYMDCTSTALYSACIAAPILASCPASASTDSPAPGSPVRVPYFNGGLSYQCQYEDLIHFTNPPTPSLCYCQCVCQLGSEPVSGTTGGGGGAGSGQAGSWGANTGAASTSDDEAPVPVQVKDWLSRSMTTAASSASVATSATAAAPATTTSAAVVQQLGPHAGFEKRRDSAL